MSVERWKGPWEKIATAPQDGRKVWVRRIHERRLIAEGWAYWGINTANSPMRQWTPGGLEGPSPPDHAYADIPKWLTEDGLYSFPAPTHWAPSKIPQ